jgi:hypothetical protein
MPQDLYKWQMRGIHIQQAFPNLSPAQREFLLTGVCPNCP